jgi:hypothetical protein
MQAKARPEWFANCRARFLRPTIDLIAPRAMVTPGKLAFGAVTSAYGCPGPHSGGRWISRVA